MALRRFAPALLLCLAACALPVSHPGAIRHPDNGPWAFEHSDLAPDPAFRFARLANGMRTIVRSNATPAGMVSIRLDFATGSLDEAPNQRGYAHFVEHMAFDGSTHVPEGDMVRLLERAGLAFGADTNASTGFEHTTYKLDLPRADPALLDTALMLLRETASELTFADSAVARERGVVLSELRDGKGYALADAHDQADFLYPRATYRQRFPIGLRETLLAADATRLRAFWQQHYVPARATLVVVGDLPPETVERAIAAHFADWRAAPAAPRPKYGKVEHHRHSLTDIWLDPALSERVTASRHDRWLVEPDNAAQRRLNLLREIGYNAINRRFERMRRLPDPPFRGAGFGTGDVFHIGRTTNLVVDVEDGRWRRGLMAAHRALDRALREGFTAAEIAEQVANTRVALQNAAEAASTRGNGALVQAALALIDDEQIPTAPASALERFTAFVPAITPQAVLAALRSEAVPLDRPLLRFQGRRSPEGGAAALRAAWDESARPGAGEVILPPIKGPFAYQSFGPPGQVVADSRDPRLGIRTIRFANGVKLNLRHTDLARDRIMVRLLLDGGVMLASRSDPLAVEMVSSLAAGGLGRHSEDDLETLFAGHAVGGGLGEAGDVFAASATTTPVDLALQLDYFAALVTDPGWAHEAEVVFRENIANYFKRAPATPRGALGLAEGGIVSGNDPRFTIQPPAAYQSLDFARLRATLGDRLAHGAIEIGLVGDFDETRAIAAVAASFGALPAREAEFRPWAEQRQRAFTGERGPHVVRHKGAADQAIVRLVWPTTDDHDPHASATLDLLEGVVGIAVRETMRERLGKSYSPGAAASQSRVWTGWGTFAIDASVDFGDVAATRAAIRATVEMLRKGPIDGDVVQRARAPLLERIDNALKGNGGWLALVDRAQSRSWQIDRLLSAHADVAAVTPADLIEAARHWLDPASAVEILVLPEGAPAP